MKRLVVTALVATLAVLPMASQAQAGFLTKMLIGAAAGGCAINAKCAAKVEGMKAAAIQKFGPRLVAKCEGNTRCTDFMARHPVIAQMAARQGMVASSAGAPASGSLSEALQSR